MPVHLIENWPKFGVDIYVYQEGRDYKVPYKVNEYGNFVLDENATVQPGEQLPVTLFIGNEIWHDLHQAIVGKALDEDDALKDARTVRDRLLTLVENDHDRMIKQTDVLFKQLIGA